MAAEPADAKGSGRSGRAQWIAIGLTALATLVVATLVLTDRDRLTPAEVDDAIEDALAEAAQEPPRSSAATVYEAVLPSVVIIEPAESETGAEAASDSAFGGAGVVISNDGRIMTAHHVVVNLDPIHVVFADGTRTTAEIEISDPVTDIAVLVPERLPGILIPAVLANPRSMQGGEAVFAIGNPFGLTGSISSGFVSGLNRSLQLPDSDLTLDGLIQFDASINPGNSGGPLVNVNGQVIGIVTTLPNASDEGAFTGIGFAVPIDIAGGLAGSPSQ